MAKYKQLVKDADNPDVDPNVILIKDKNTYVPKDENNIDWQEYLAWVAEGNTPEPADE